IDTGAEVDDPLGKQMRIDVHDAFAAWVLGDHVGDRVAAHAASSVVSMPSVFVRRRITRTSWKSSTMPSMNPYCFACSAVYQRSWSESSKIRSTGCPVS